MTSKRVVLYARLSITTDESVSIERQLQAGRDTCKARGWTVVAEYVDDGVSASANAPENRRGWQQVLAHPKGTYDLVLIWKIDRLARKVLDFLHADQALQKRGAGVAAVEQNIDMTTTEGRGFATMLAVFAEMEADAIRSRVKAARRSLIAAGRVPGGAAPFGYRNIPNPDGPGKVLAKDPEQISYVIEAAERVMRGDSFNSVAGWLDEVAPRTARSNSAARWTITVTKRMLSNPVLAGMTAYNPGNNTKVRGADVLRGSEGMPVIREDLAILSISDFRKLQSILETSQPYASRSESYLSGLVWCGECNRKMHRNAKTVHGKKVRVFQCQGKDGCGQQVTNLEAIVERRYFRDFNGRWAMGYEVVSSDHDIDEINRQIHETTRAMQADDADMQALSERLQGLKELRKNTPPPQTRRTITGATSEEDWERDPRQALLRYAAGVRLKRGRVGSKFDDKRLSWINRGEVFTDIAAAFASLGIELNGDGT
ncbi:recombinase family protein [Nocardioides sp. Leaf307]|uniref:recombinase family protein n=1 Tax=Nocardioides sp. Leaf307 TaxID=1736331 RepID=UPI0009EBCEA5|nr:recombinase family protein [Nocardioides sp. Leaf307]